MLLLFIEQHFKDDLGGFQVTVVELISNVPAQRPELSPFLDD